MRFQGLNKYNARVKVPRRRMSSFRNGMLARLLYVTNAGRMYLATPAILSCLAFSPLHQSSPPEQPTSCQCHKPHGEGYLTRIRHSVVTSVAEIGEQPEYETVSGPWWAADACDCDWIQPPDPCNRFSCSPQQFTSYIQEQTCWSVQHTVGLSIQLTLLNDLRRSIGSFEIANGESHCVTSSQSRTYMVDRSQCWHGLSREIHTRVRNTGRVVLTKTCRWWRGKYDHSIWVWLFPVGDTMCQSVAATADAWRTYQFRLQVPTLACTYACGGRCPLPAEPDEYDNRRREPCCEHIQPCEPIDAPLDRPCCGCEQSR